MAEPSPLVWTCPRCGRRVPRRVETCHCGLERGVAEAQAAREAAPLEAAPRRRSRLPVDPREALGVMPRDVKAILGAGALVMALGLGWLVLGPSRPSSTPAVLGYVDAGPPPDPKPTPRPQPPLPMPWWR
jgi:hypothetical protein